MKILFNKRIVLIISILFFVSSSFLVNAQEIPDHNTLVNFIKESDAGFDTNGLDIKALQQKVIYELTQKQGFTYGDAVFAVTGEVPEKAQVTIQIKKVTDDTSNEKATISIPIKQISSVPVEEMTTFLKQQYPNNNYNNLTNDELRVEYVWGLVRQDFNEEEIKAVLNGDLPSPEGKLQQISPLTLDNEDLKNQLQKTASEKRELELYQQSNEQNQEFLYIKASAEEGIFDVNNYTGDKDISVLKYVTGFKNLDKDIDKVYVTKSTDSFFTYSKDITAEYKNGLWVDEDGNTIDPALSEVLTKRRDYQEINKMFENDPNKDKKVNILTGGQKEPSKGQQGDFVALEGDFFEQKLGGQEAVKNLSIFFNNLFQFGVYIAGFLATIMIAIGGITYMTTGAVDGKKLGKEMITSALTGLLIILFSWILLNQINPDLLNLNI